MGLLIAITIITLWAGHLFFSLVYIEASLENPIFILHTFFQGYLFTGLFITAHDAMHGTVSKYKSVNLVIGWISSLLFAGMFYNKLIKNHFKHHNYPGTKDDPDFNVKTQNLFMWWFTFLIRYATIYQIVIMSVIYNIFTIWFSELSIWTFWLIPSFLGSFQLFYFGTYLPHKKPHKDEMEPHKARSQKKNHLWAMASCYFFGYHFEHHDSPGTPWWKLYKLKNKNT